jgi:hypothetical protein
MNCCRSIENMHSYAGRASWSRRLNGKQSRRRKSLPRRLRNPKKSNCRSNESAATLTRPSVKSSRSGSSQRGKPFRNVSHVPELRQIAQQKVLIFALSRGNADRSLQERCVHHGGFAQDPESIRVDGWKFSPRPGRPDHRVKFVFGPHQSLIAQFPTDGHLLDLTASTVTCVNDEGRAINFTEPRNSCKAPSVVGP